MDPEEQWRADLRCEGAVASVAACCRGRLLVVARVSEPREIMQQSEDSFSGSPPSPRGSPGRAPRDWIAVLRPEPELHRFAVISLCRASNPGASQLLNPQATAGLPAFVDRELKASVASAARSAFRLCATVLGTDPPVYRILDVAGSMSLADLHRALCASIGWYGAEEGEGHLHVFHARGASFVPEPCGPGGDCDVDEAGVRLCDLRPAPGDVFHYEYDMASAWQVAGTANEGAGRGAGWDPAHFDAGAVDEALAALAGWRLSAPFP
eukprot:tig00021238_g19544.t1